MRRRRTRWSRRKWRRSDPARRAASLTRAPATATGCGGCPVNHVLRFARFASRAPVLLAATALFVMMSMTFFDVVLRSTINTPIEAATELTRILMAVVVFSALPVVSGRAGHISVDVLDWVFTRRAARWEAPKSVGSK